MKSHAHITEWRALGISLNPWETYIAIKMERNHSGSPVLFAQLHRFKKGLFEAASVVYGHKNVAD